MEQHFFIDMIEWFVNCYNRFDGLLKGLLSIVSFSFITGVIRAIVEKKKISSVCLKCLSRYFLIFIMVELGSMLDTQILGEAGVLRITISMFYIGNEGLQLLDNVAYLGLPIPKQLRIFLQQLHDDIENKKDE